MTENKRFTMVITGSDGSFHYWDKVTDERITSTLELEDKLNGLSKENEQLKQSLGFCKDNVKRLHDENEQLKKELFETKEAYLLETSDEVDRILYVPDEIEELRENIFKKGIYNDR